MKRRYSTSRRRGYTLLELVVSTTSATFLLAGVTGSVYIATMAFDDSDSHSAKANTSAQVADQMMAEMQYATRFTERTTKAVTFNIPDRDGDGVEETLRFAWSGVAGDPLTKEYNGGSPTTMIADVESLDFEYLTRSLGAAPGPPPPSSEVIFESYAAATSPGSVLSFVVPVPKEVVAGDLLIAAIAFDSGVLDDVPGDFAGWTRLYAAHQNADVTFGVWWKIATDSEPSGYTWQLLDEEEQMYGWIMRFTGHDPTNPIHAQATHQGAEEYPLSPAVTTTVDDTLILRLGAFQDDYIQVGNPGLPGHTAILMDGMSPVSGGAGYVKQDTAGGSGTSNFYLKRRKDYVTVTLAIAPE